MWNVFRAEQQRGRWPIRVLVLAAFPILAAVGVQGESVPSGKPKPKLIIVQDKLPTDWGQASWGDPHPPSKPRETIGSTIVIERSLGTAAAEGQSDAAKQDSPPSVKRELPPAPKSSIPASPPLPQPPSFPAIDRPTSRSTPAPAGSVVDKSVASRTSHGPHGKSTLSERAGNVASRTDEKTPQAAAPAVVVAASTPVSLSSSSTRTLSSRSPARPGADRTAHSGTGGRPEAAKPGAEAALAEPSIYVAGRKKEDARPPQGTDSKSAAASETAESKAFTERRRGASEAPLVRCYPGASDVQQANFVSGEGVPNRFPGGPASALAPAAIDRPAWEAFPGWTIVSLGVVIAFGLALSLLAFTVILLTVRLQNATSQVPSIHVEVAQPAGAGMPVPVLQTVESRRPSRRRSPRRGPSPPSPAVSVGSGAAAGPGPGRVADFGTDVLAAGALGAIFGENRTASADGPSDGEQSILQQIYEDNLSLQRSNE